MDETTYLLSTNANAAHLKKSVQQAREGSEMTINQSGAITSEQAAKLRELFNTVKASRRNVEDALYFSKEHHNALHTYAQAELQLDNYITSLTVLAQTGESK